ncbi:MAG: hypothetical protein JWR72_3323 [Flavisolibacter sp.]|jgi:hypothetical protein|nr:hypothetical protein [Flavisolibacter sp.]
MFYLLVSKLLQVIAVANTIIPEGIAEQPYFGYDLMRGHEMDADFAPNTLVLKGGGDSSQKKPPLSN